MTKAEAKLARRAAALWVRISKKLLKVFNSPVKEMEIKDLADTAVRTLTGSRHVFLEKRIAKLPTKGFMDCHLFKALTGIRLRKAEQILSSAAELIESKSSIMSEIRKQCILPALQDAFEEGAEQIQLYERKDNRRVYFGMTAGTQVFVVEKASLNTEKVQACRAELIPADKVGGKTGLVLLVLSGKARGAYASPSQLGDLYRIIYGEAEKQFRTKDHYFCMTSRLASALTKKAEEVLAEGAWSVSDGLPKERKDFEEMVSEEICTADLFLDPLPLTQATGKSSWKQGTEFRRLVANRYAREMSKQYAQEKKPDRAEKEAVDVQPKPEESSETAEETSEFPECPKALALKLGISDEIPKNRQSFMEQCRITSRFLETIEPEISEMADLAEELRKTLARLEEHKQALEKKSLTLEHIRVLKRLQLIWEGMYAAVPYFSETADDRMEVFSGITEIAKHFLGSNQRIFYLLKDWND